jgi:predicted glycosyltransferase
MITDKNVFLRSLEDAVNLSIDDEDETRVTTLVESYLDQIWGVINDVLDNMDPSISDLDDVISWARNLEEAHEDLVELFSYLS